MRLGEVERGLLAKLLEAETTIRSEPFGILREYGRTSVMHPALYEAVEEVTLARLDAAEAFVVTGRDAGKVHQFHLAADADELLERMIRAAGGSTLLDEARAEVDRRDARIAAGIALRRRSAERFGRIVYGLVLPIALVVIAAVTWVSVAGAPGQVVAVVLVGVAIVTTGLDWTGAGVARWAEEKAASWADRRLASWTDPEGER